MSALLPASPSHAFDTYVVFGAGSVAYFPVIVGVRLKAPLSLALSCAAFPKLGPGEPVRIDDALGHQVQYVLMAWWPVGREYIVKAMVLADDHDDVFDRRGSTGTRGLTWDRAR